MPGPDPSFPAKKPVSAWNKPLKTDFKGLFGALSKGTLHGVTGQWGELGGDAVDLLTSLGIDSREAPQLAWLLIRRSALAAMADLHREVAALYPEPDKEQVESLSEQLDEAIGKTKVAIDVSFFERPAASPLLAALQDPFSKWLQASGLPGPAADSIALRLPSYFVAALHSEWRRSAATYEPIREAVNTPFTRAAERERAWASYGVQLQRQVDEPMFGEAFGLRQVYVPLRAFYFERSEKCELERFQEGQRPSNGPKRVAVFLEPELDKWLENEDRRDGYRVISGGPGSGKSSFARMYAARLAEAGKHRLLFVPLHQLNLTSSLVTSVGEFVRLAEILPGNPLEPEAGEDRLLIVFDGLDELAQQGRIAAETARDFIREVLKVVEIRNNEQLRLRVMFTGREPVVQASESEFRDPRRVLHVLPYLISDAKSDTWKSGEEILAEDQRGAWWQRYGVSKGRGYSGLPESMKRRDLDEITAQPLLNYLVALGFDRGKLDFSKDLNLHDIYEDLLKAVHERTWERRQHLAIQGFEFEDFRRILEEISLAAWHGNGRTTTVNEIETHCQAAGLSGLLARFAETAKTGVTRVLTAFYFRQSGRAATGDATFEFTHKSFREYLTSLRIIRTLERIEDEVSRRDQSFDAGWDERAALKHWAEICGPAAMDLELLRFVISAVGRHRKEKAAQWQTLLCRLIAAMLRAGMPMELLCPRPTYFEEAQQARNAEETLLALLNACAVTTATLSHVNWPSSETGNTSAGAWIRRLQGQRTGPANVLALECLSWLDLSDCVLDIVDLYDANLVNTNLVRARLHYSTLVHANLSRANLEGAILTGANLTDAYLDGAILTGANLKRANLERANLERANLTGTNLEGANLEGANLRMTSLDKSR